MSVPKLSPAVLALGLLATPPLLARSEATGICVTDSVGVDLSLATTMGQAYLGRAWGQTFIAQDTLIQAVIVWRIPQEAASDSSDMKFYLTQVDTTTGNPAAVLIQEGPKLNLTTSDTSRPTRIQYTFDPPISLPRPGRYCFWIQACDGYFDLLIDPNPDFPDGHLWESARSSFSGCILVGATSFDANLAFQVVFCRSSLTATQRESWGTLKVRYR